MRVYVMTPSRNKMLLDGVETLRDVKRQITTKIGIPARQQLVYFKGKQLKSLRRPLRVYHVRDDSTLYLVKRLGICRCLACRNSRYIEREEMEEERQQRLLRDPPDDGDLSEAEVTSEVTGGVTTEVIATTGGKNTVTWLMDRGVVDWQQSPGLDVSQEEQDPAALEVEETDVEGVGEEEGATEVEDLVEEEEMEEADEDYVEVEEDAEEVEEEEEEIEQTDAEAEDGAEEIEEANEDADDVEDEEEEAMEEVAGETEDLNEETEQVDAADEDLELSGEDADDEEEQDAAEEEEETEIIEAEDVEDEQLNDHDDNPADEEPEDTHEEEEDESATILYSLVTGREDNPRREELELATGTTADDDEEEDRPAERVFARQAAFEEDGANSVGEEDPDIADLEDEEELTLTADGLFPEEDGVPERVEDLLLAMTRPTPDPEGEEEPLEEQYPEDDPLFDPPDEEDPLRAPCDEDDAGYISGDEMDHV